MNTDPAQPPPIALALGRLRPLRAWPYAPRPTELHPATPNPRAQPMATHDFLRIVPEPALTGELPPPPPSLAIPGPEAARTYWFDL